MNRKFLFFLWLGLSHSIFAGVYDIHFNRVSPLSDPQTCQNFVGKTVQDFAQQSGVRIIDFGCQSDDFTFKAWNAIITYQSPKRVELTSTYTGSVYKAAFYKAKQDCEGQLDLQIDLFREATGLNPLTAYCMLDTSVKGVWESRVDGVGEPLKKPYTAGFSLWGTILDQQTVFSKYKSVGENYGITIFETGIYPSDYDKQIVNRIYATEPYTLDDYDGMKYAAGGSCAHAANRVSSLLESAPNRVVAFCERKHGGKIDALHITSFKKVFKPTYAFKGKELTSSYSTLIECEKAADKYSNLSPDIYGAVCSGYDHYFTIHLFSRP